MKTLVLLALVGLGAQLVDGSLGMAYGVTSTTLLLAIGTNPAAASATIHLAEIGTTLASGPGALEVRQRRLEGRREDRRPRRGRRLRRRDVPVQPLHRGRRAGDVADPALAGRLHPGPVHAARHRPPQPGQADAQALPRPARPGRRLRRRHRRRRLGPGRHPGDPGQRPDGAAQGDRLDRHLGVPGGAGREPRLPARAGLPGHQRRLGGAACSVAGWSPPRSPRGWCGTSRRACSARWSAG